jgi:type VI secretion system protein ImpC
VSDHPKIKSTGISFGIDNSTSKGTAGATDDARAPREAAGSTSSRGPLRIVVLSGLSASAYFSTRATPPARPIPVDKLSFERLMGQLAPAWVIRVADPFEPDAEPLSVELRWADPKSMRADAIAEQVSVLRALVEARRIVVLAKERKISAADARSQLARILPRAAWADSLSGEVVAVRAPAPAPAGPSVKKADSIDALFEKVGLKEEPRDQGAAPAPKIAPPAAPSEFSAIVAAVARGGRAARSHAPAVVGTALERVDRAFTRMLSEILRHPETRRLERAWRGLRLLVDGSNSRAGVEIDVVPVEKDGVADALRDLGEPIGADAARAPIDLVLVDHEVGADEAGVGMLMSWARVAREMCTPIVVNGNAALVGLSSIDELPAASRRATGLGDGRPAFVRAAQAEEAARWVSVALNGVLVRAAYTPSTSRLREIPFTEDAADPTSHVFAGPAMPIGVLCAQSYLRTGWPTQVVGAHDGAVPDLAVREITEDGQSFAIPVETFVTDDVVRDAARAGLAVLGCAPNHDAAILSRAPTFHRRAESAATLGDQLFVGRFAHAVQQVAAALPADVDPLAGAKAAAVALLELFSDAGPAGPEMSASISGGTLQVTVRPRRFAGVGVEEITLGARMG